MIHSNRSLSVVKNCQAHIGRSETCSIETRNRVQGEGQKTCPMCSRLWDFVYVFRCDVSDRRSTSFGWSITDNGHVVCVRAEGSERSISMKQKFHRQYYINHFRSQDHCKIAAALQNKGDVVDTAIEQQRYYVYTASLSVVSSNIKRITKFFD